MSQVVVVTGGSSGIGLAVATAFAAAGCEVLSIDVAEGLQIARVRTAIADVTDADSLTRAIDAFGLEHGRVDVLVNNAGIGCIGQIEDNSLEEWARVLDINVMGLVRVTRACLPLLRASSGGCVINVSSIAATTGIQNRAAHSASKGAVHALTLAMAADLLADGIRVNAVSPGTADTPFVERLLDLAADPTAERAALAARQPIGRLVTPDEVAGAVVYLASPLAAATTGTSLAVDGGFSGLRVRNI